MVTRLRLLNTSLWPEAAEAEAVSWGFCGRHRLLLQIFQVAAEAREVSEPPLDLLFQREQLTP